MFHKDELNTFLKRFLEIFFESLAFTAVLLFVAEYIKTGLVTNNFHYLILLTTLLFSGMIVLSFPSDAIQKPRRIFRIFKKAVILIVSVFFALAISRHISDAYALLQIVPYLSGIGIYFSLSNLLEND